MGNNATNIEEIFKLHEEKLNDADKALIKRAYDFAKTAHEGQKRASGEPYFYHVVETAKNLARYGMDSETIAAGLMHDTIEDGCATEEQIQKEFGEEILFLINGVTKLGKVKYRGADRHIESLRKFLLALVKDYRVLMIKLADRLHNLQTLQYVRPEKQKRIALESLEVYAPLASRLGIGKLKGELEDAAFPYIYPKEYAQVEEILKSKSAVTEGYLKSMEIKISEALHKEKIDDFKISMRMKHKYSLWQKLKRYDMDIEKIYDLGALRVIVPTIEDCYHVLGLIHSIWRPLPGRIKDLIALPKLNGYQSIHTTIFTGDGGITEIQIRTPEMHGRAEYGVASHFTYKENNKNIKADNEHEKFVWIKQFNDLENKVSNEKPEKVFENIKQDFFSDRIFIFTPKGDVIDLPEGSTPIDFAYAIHSDVGDHAIACTINGKYSKLFTKLQNSDIVKIETKKDSHPSSKWNDYTKTSLAKRHIRQYLDSQDGIFTSILKRFK